MKRKIATILSALFILTSIGSVANAKDTSANGSSNVLGKVKAIYTQAVQKFKVQKTASIPKEHVKKFKMFDDNFKNLTLDQKKELIKKNFETRINDAVKNGRLTQEEADNILKKFSENLNSWDGTAPFKFKDKLNKKFDKNFDSLTLEKKKELVIKHFENKLTMAVKNGRITKEKADALLKEFETKLNNWDGNKETLREIKKSLWDQVKPESNQSSSTI